MLTQRVDRTSDRTPCSLECAALCGFPNTGGLPDGLVSTVLARTKMRCGRHPLPAHDGCEEDMCWVPPAVPPGSAGHPLRRAPHPFHACRCALIAFGGGASHRDRSSAAAPCSRRARRCENPPGCCQRPDRLAAVCGAVSACCDCHPRWTRRVDCCRIGHASGDRVCLRRHADLALPRICCSD